MLFGKMNEITFYSQIEEIQNSKRLQSLKMTYEGSLKVMYENHNKSVARLQAQYDEAMKESDFFDSESWLRVSIVRRTELEKGSFQLFRRFRTFIPL